MYKSADEEGWARHFVRRSEHYRTTWKLRLGAPPLVAAIVWLTTGWWGAALARSLVCEGSVGPSDAILIETFDLSYPLFARAGELRRAGLAPRVIAMVATDTAAPEQKEVSFGAVETMARLARLGRIEIVEVGQTEPITLNAALALQQFARREQIRSLIVVTPVLRSRRSCLIYGETLSPAGIALRFQPVEGRFRIDDWMKSWHGVQDVLQQWTKLQYYRFYVLPFRQ